MTMMTMNELSQSRHRILAAALRLDDRICSLREQIAAARGMRAQSMINQHRAPNMPALRPRTPYPGPESS